MGILGSFLNIGNSSLGSPRNSVVFSRIWVHWKDPDLRITDIRSGAKGRLQTSVPTPSK